MNDLDRVLIAIAEVESQGGRNNYPRFERSYAPKGQQFTIQGHIIEGTGTNFTVVAESRWTRFGLASACSFGPHQMLYHTAADRGYQAEPWRLWNPDLEKEWVTVELKRQFVKGANTISKIGDAWNSGSYLDANIPGDYITKLVSVYVKLGGDPNASLIF
jgi:hypothetical protein